MGDESRHTNQKAGGQPGAHQRPSLALWRLERPVFLIIASPIEPDWPACDCEWEAQRNSGGLCLVERNDGKSGGAPTKSCQSAGAFLSKPVAHRAQSLS